MRGGIVQSNGKLIWRTTKSLKRFHRRSPGSDWKEVVQTHTTYDCVVCCLASEASWIESKTTSGIAHRRRGRGKVERGEFELTKGKRDQMVRKTYLSPLHASSPGPEWFWCEVNGSRRWKEVFTSKCQNNWHFFHRNLCVLWGLVT